MKMDGCQNKGVGGGAFCKWLNINGIDGGKSRRSNRVAVEKNWGRGVPYPGYFAKCAEALDFKRLARNICFRLRSKCAEGEGSKGVRGNRGCKGGRMRGCLAEVEWNFHNP
jgi:hypothetical protein